MDKFVVTDDQNEVSSALCRVSDNSAKSSFPSSPLLFRQYTVREMITPTKTGFISLKQSSFSASYGDFCNDTSQMKSFWTAYRTSEQIRVDPKQAPSDQRNILKLRRIGVPPCKKLKLCSSTSPRKTSKGHHNQLDRQNPEHTEDNKLPLGMILFLSIFPLLICFIIAYAMLLRYVDLTNNEPNARYVLETLREKVIGQEEAVYSLGKFLEGYLNVEKRSIIEVPIILLTGSSGVGKSLAVSTVVSNFPPSGKAGMFSILPPPSVEVVLEKLGGIGPHLIVLDNLLPKSSTDIIKWTRNFQREADWQQKRVLLILVFNVQMWEDISSQDTSMILRDRGSALHSTFNSSGLRSHLIHFTPLREEHIKICIRKALSNRGMLNNPSFEKNVDTISKQINHMKEGCKPVWSRTLLLE